MKVSKISLPSPLPIGPTNVYVIEDDQIALVDAGPKTDEAAEALVSGLRQLGYSLADIDYLVITHAHEDHYGLARFVRDGSSAQVCAHAASVPSLANREENYKRREQVGHGGLFASVGAPSELAVAHGSSTKYFKGLGEQVAVDRVLNDGDIFRVGRTEFDVMHTPGHSPGAICLYSAADRVFFAGDQLLPHISTNAIIDGSLHPGSNRSKTLLNYRSSLQRIQGLDLAILYPGHGENVIDHRSLIDQRMNSYERRKRRVLDAMGTREMTPYQLAKLMYPDVSDIDVFLSISEVVGLLDLLEEDGMVTWRHENDVIFYRSSASTFL
jgi:glyoxylase-like metal-dependent hydrolase (beta-lactamase superfamily II)